MAIGTPTNLGFFSSTTTPTTGSITTANAVASGAMIGIMRYANAFTGTFTSAPTDSSSNTYVQAPAGIRVTSVAPVLDLWYCLNATAMASSSTISFNFSGSALREAVFAFTCTGIATSNALDTGASPANNGTSNTSTAATAISVPGLYSAELLLYAITTAVNITSPVLGSGWTQISGGGSITSSANILPVFQIISSPNTYVAAPTWTGSALNRLQTFGFIGAGATFQGTGGGGGGLMMGVG